MTNAEFDYDYYDFAYYDEDAQSDFISESAGNIKYPDKWIQTKKNEQFDETDFLICPLLPTVKRNLENKLALHLEKDDTKILTK